ncbi:GIY-YIG catalytic domain protein [compost metagenome]
MSADSVWYLYLLECTGDTIYTGITTDVERRFAEHLSGKGAKYTRSRKPIRIMARLRFETKSEALKAEIEIKQMSSAQKRAFCAQHQMSASSSSQESI